MIEYRVGDVLNALDNKDVGMVAHGVNCIGAFGSGIAGQISHRYPDVRTNYMSHHFGKGWDLGHVQLNVLDNDGLKGRIIANCATQYACGGMPGVLYASYEAIDRVMVQLHGFCDEHNIKLGIPLIGAGLAGGDWTTIENIIDKIFVNNTIYIYKLEEV